MSVDDSRSGTEDSNWDKDGRYRAPKIRRRAASDEMALNHSGQPVFGTRLGLRRAYLPDGRFVIEGCLRGQRIG